MGRDMIALFSTGDTPEFPAQRFEPEHHHKCEDRGHKNYGKEILEIPTDDYVIHTKPVLFQDAW